MLTLIAYRFAVDSQLPRLPYMTRLDAFFLTSTLLVFFSLIEVLVTTILDNNSKRNGPRKLIAPVASSSRQFSRSPRLQFSYIPAA